MDLHFARTARPDKQSRPTYSMTRATDRTIMGTNFRL